MGETLIRVTDLTFEDENDLVVKMVGRTADGRRVAKDVYGWYRKLLFEGSRLLDWMSQNSKSRPDEQRLRELYWDEDKPLTEIAEKLDCHTSTVHYWMEKYDIDRRSSWAESSTIRCYAGPKSGGTRYTMVEHFVDGEYDCRIYSHQLVAIAEGADPERVFATDEFCTHHINGHEFDNRPSNLEVMTKRAHQALDFMFSLSEEEREEVLQIAEARADV